MKRDLHVHTHYSGNTTIKHAASRINGEITARHIASLMPWVDGIEIRNGSRLAEQNHTAECLADACRTIGVAGSDSHTRRGIGRTWVEAPAARNREEFLTELHAGRVRVGGRHGNFFTMASDLLRLAGGLLRRSRNPARAVTTRLASSRVRARRHHRHAAGGRAVRRRARSLHPRRAFQSRVAVRSRQAAGNQGSRGGLR